MIIITMPQNRAPPEEILVCVVEPYLTGVERGRKSKSTPSTRCPSPSDIYFKSLNGLKNVDLHLSRSNVGKDKMI